MDHATLDSYTVLRGLGKGGFSQVKLVSDASGLHFAAKILRNLDSNSQARFQDIIHNEVEHLKQLCHPNIIKFFEVHHNGIYTKRDNTQTIVTYLLLEVCPNGNLYDYVLKTGFLDEGIARFYFKQLVSALEACHKEGICHRDLKPQNILFDAQQNVKLADFGFSMEIAGRRGTGFLGSYVGTEECMAPEILMHQRYKGAGVDIFSLGVVLFIMRTSNRPFMKAILSDSHYALFLNNEQGFWNMHARSKPEGHFTEDFKALIKGLLAFEPASRFSLSDIQNSAWYNGPVINPVTGESTSIETALNNSRIQNSMITKAHRTRLSGRLYRGVSSIRSCSIINEDYRIKNITKEQIGVFRYCLIFTDLEIKVVLECIIILLESIGASFDEYNYESFLKVRTESLEAIIKFYRCEGNIMIEFRAISGCEFELHALYQDINAAITITREEVLKIGENDLLY